MSGKPNHVGVVEIVGLLSEIEAAETRAVEIRALLPEAERLEERARALRRSVIAAMRNMDVASNSNAGWEGRVVWFLNAVRRAAEVAATSGEGV